MTTIKLNKTIALATLAVMVGVTGMATNGNAENFHKTRNGQYERGSLFDRLDINNNGEVSSREFRYRYGNTRTANRAFARLDTNRSGQLGQREVARGYDMLAHMRMRG